MAADTSDSNTHMRVLLKVIRGVGTLMNDQERVITNIHAAVGHFLALSADTNPHTERLATALNDTASGLNCVPGKLKLRTG